MEKKGRLLQVLKLLRDQTDEEHMLSTNQIIDHFAAQGIHVNRKTVKDDMITLEENGYDIITDKHSSNFYALGEREFQEPEVRLLIDAVAASKFITQKKTEELHRKLTGFVSVHRAEMLDSHLYFEGVKPENEKVYLIVDRINEAIDRGLKIRFHYFDYTPDKKRYMRSDGAWYVSSPYALLWSEDQYYLIGWSDKHEKVLQLRVDRMDIPEVLKNEPIVPKPDDFDMSRYAQRVFKMYDGTDKEVELECDNDLMKSVIDRFGEDVPTTIPDEQHFRITVTASTSPTFFSWVFQFGPKMRIIRPASVIEEYRAMLENTLGAHTK